MLIELSLAVMLLLFVSLWVFRTNLQTIRPRNWAMTQAISDAYLTGVLAQSEAADFSTIVGATSPWPDISATTPETPNTSSVIIGSLPGGHQIQGTLVQVRVADPDNWPATPTAAQAIALAQSNPARVESWHLQNHLTYTVGGREYVKSRTTVRTR